MSPVRHSECTRTSTGFSESISPLTIAMCNRLSTSFSYTTALNSPPTEVGIMVSAARWTKDSVRMRYSIKSSMVQIPTPCFSLNFSSAGIRAIVPSSSITSQITPAGVNPAKRARSIEPSVCPALTITPPLLALNGNICPGRTRSRGRQSSATAVKMVVARSCAEIPVLTPQRASIDTVKPVPKGEVLLSTIGGRSSASHFSGVIARHTRPLP